MIASWLRRTRARLAVWKALYDQLNERAIARQAEQAQSDGWEEDDRGMAAYSDRPSRKIPRAPDLTE